ncbi:unnamed protein product [Nezara viridula]|uniref:Uncharacterized protein n=1 Tax=Nezara viridula TaxID=85310 RepID=A0A9P0E515_NEZVI|nr:unnamed protein product [Nezara viridula]
MTKKKSKYRKYLSKHSE